MAIFGKTPAGKSGGAPRPGRKAPAASRVVSARELAAAAAERHTGRRPAFEPLGESSLRGASIIDWSTAPDAIEVQQANPGLCDALENAALMFASGQDGAARALLEQGVETDPEARQSTLAWLALLDLVQRAGDREVFDQLAMKYVLQFESSAPSWEEGAPTARGESVRGGGYIPLNGELDASSPGPLDGLRRAVEIGVPRARIDLSALTGFDEPGARSLANLLARARRAKMDLAVQRPDRLVAMLEEAVGRGREGGEGAWLLSLELLQWVHDQAKFDERALEFAVTFELSPPSWEPTAKSGPGAPASKPAAGRRGAQPAVEEVEVLELDGVLTGATPPQLADVEQFGALRDVATIDMSRVERVDFVAAGALLNAIARIEGREKALQIAGATPIVRALLLLIGVSPRHFVRRAG